MDLSFYNIGEYSYNDDDTTNGEYLFTVTLLFSPEAKISKINVGYTQVKDICTMLVSIFKIASAI